MSSSSCRQRRQTGRCAGESLEPTLGEIKDVGTRLCAGPAWVEAVRPPRGSARGLGTSPSALTNQALTERLLCYRAGTGRSRYNDNPYATHFSKSHSGNAFNVAPNRTLQRAGSAISSLTMRTQLDQLPQVTTRWVLDRSPGEACEIVDLRVFKWLCLRLFIAWLCAQVWNSSSWMVGACDRAIHSSCGSYGSRLHRGETDMARLRTMAVARPPRVDFQEVEAYAHQESIEESF